MGCRIGAGGIGGLLSCFCLFFELITSSFIIFTFGFVEDVVGSFLVCLLVSVGDFRCFAVVVDVMEGVGEEDIGGGGDDVGVAGGEIIVC